MYMPVSTRSKARTWQPLGNVASSTASHPGRVSASSSELPQQSPSEAGVNCSNRTVECLLL